MKPFVLDRYGRIVFPFNRTNFGRLRSLIDVINQH